MFRLPRFSIGTLMVVIVVIAIDRAIASRVLAAGIGSKSGLFALAWLAMANVLGVDAYHLARRALAGRPPFGPGWSWQALGGSLLLVAACLYGPFVWLLGERAVVGSLIVGLLMAPMLSGFVGLYPVHWLFPYRHAFEMPIVALTATLLTMSLVRLVARGHVIRACGLALLFAIPSSLFAHAAFSV